MTLAKVFPKVKCSSSGIAGLLALHHGQGDCRKRSSLHHVCAKGVTFANDMKADGSRRASLDSLKGGEVLPSPCASHFFNPYARGFQAQVSWQCQCRAECEGWAAATFPSRWWEGTYGLFALFSWCVEAWQLRWWDA